MSGLRSANVSNVQADTKPRLTPSNESPNDDNIHSRPPERVKRLPGVGSHPNGGASGSRARTGPSFARALPPFLIRHAEQTSPRDLVFSGISTLNFFRNKVQRVASSGALNFSKPSRATDSSTFYRISGTPIFPIRSLFVARRMLASGHFHEAMLRTTTTQPDYKHDTN